MTKDLQSEKSEFIADIDNIQVKDGKLVIKLSTIMDNVNLNNIAYMQKTGIKAILTSIQTKLPVNEKEDKPKLVKESK